MSNIKLYHDYSEALNQLSKPSLFLDLEGLESNIQWILKHSKGKHIRLATKSLRSIEVIRKVLQSSPIFKGLMTYTLDEALWLKSQGFSDILMGYPTMDKISLTELAQESSGIILMVDRLEHIELLKEVINETNTTFSICLDIDLSMDLPGLRFGVYRSSLKSISRLEKILDLLKGIPQISLVGVMGYEAQIAGVTDDNSSLIRMLKKMSLPIIKQRREQMVKLIQSYGHKLKLVNGGGTGSLISTSEEDCVTEITIGSALYAPVLFDHYKDFKLTPALLFALPIVRNPEENIYTVLGGGYIASGTQEKIKSPLPYLPAGLKYIKHEGAGEVQSPLQNSSEVKLHLGDKIIFRHAKAGEICERFNEIHFVVSKKIISTHKTYRGEGKCFL